MTVNIHFESDKIVKNSQFDDVYFSTHDGLFEKDYVFVQGNNLAQKLQNFSQLNILEFGFGAGVAFAATYLEASKNPNSNLKYYSIEQHPLNREQLSRIFGNWPALDPLRSKFLQQYPENLASKKNIDIVINNCSLKIIIGNASDIVKNLYDKIDCFYLDGFNPHKNPDMWSKEIFYHIKRLSKPASSLATYSTARIVKEGVKQAGFRIIKIPGYGKKREMLTASFVAEPR